MRFREAGPENDDGVLQVHRLAFGRDDEAALVRSLLQDDGARPWLSFVRGHCSPGNTGGSKALMQHSHNALGQPIGFPLPDWRSPDAPSREPMAGRFCRLEVLDPGLHAASLHAANAIDVDGRMWTYLPYGPFDTPGSYRAWTGEMSRRNDPLFFAIVDQAAGRAVGVASYLRIDPPAGSIEVGHISYSPLLQRTPAATEAMFLMMERAFALGYRRYEWKCDALNQASRAAAQRLGFRFEGVFRQATVVKGRNRDTAWFSVIDRDWPVLRDAFLRWLQPANFDEQGKQRSRLSALTANVPPASPGHAAGRDTRRG